MRAGGRGAPGCLPTAAAAALLRTERCDRENTRSRGDGVAIAGPFSLLAPMETPPDERADARRTVRILYLCMAVGIVLPFVLYWVLR